MANRRRVVMSKIGEGYDVESGRNERSRIDKSSNADIKTLKHPKAIFIFLSKKTLHRDASIFSPHRET